MCRIENDLHEKMRRLNQSKLNSTSAASSSYSNIRVTFDSGFKRCISRVPKKGIIFWQHRTSSSYQLFCSQSFRIQAIRTQTQMIRTQVTGCFVPILFTSSSTETAFNCFTCICRTLNSAEKKSRWSSYTLWQQIITWKSPNSVPYCTFDKEVFYKGCILGADDRETQDTRKISKHLKHERMRVM